MNLRTATITIKRPPKSDDGQGGTAVGTPVQVGTAERVRISMASASEVAQAQQAGVDVTHVTTLRGGVDIKRDDIVEDGSISYDVTHKFLSGSIPPRLHVFMTSRQKGI